MTNPSQGDTVTVHLTFRLADGSVVRSTREGDPIDITLGAQQVMPEARALVPWIERAFLDMAQGENRTVTIEAECPLRVISRHPRGKLKTSAFGGKADIPGGGSEGPLLATSGHSDPASATLGLQPYRPLPPSVSGIT